MKSVLISIQPYWVKKIANGEKTIEVRKTRPKLETPFKVYIYCTKDESMYRSGEKFFCPNDDIGNGKVIGEFICDRIECFSQWQNDYPSLLRHINLYAGTNGDYKFLDSYLKGKKDGYGWHISNLVIYDKPKELSEFWSADKCPYASKDGCIYKYYCFRAGQTKRCGNTLKRPPQSWCYTEEQENDRVD